MEGCFGLLGVLICVAHQIDVSAGSEGHHPTPAAKRAQAPDVSIEVLDRFLLLGPVVENRLEYAHEARTNPCHKASLPHGVRRGGTSRKAGRNSELEVLMCVAAVVGGECACGTAGKGVLSRIASVSASRRCATSQRAGP